MGMIVSISRAVTVLACIFAGVDLVYVIVGKGQSAIQQAAGAAIAVAMVVIPYVFTRVFEGFFFRPAETWEGKPLRPKHDGVS